MAAAVRQPRCLIAQTGGFASPPFDGFALGLGESKPGLERERNVSAGRRARLETRVRWNGIVHASIGLGFTVIPKRSLSCSGGAIWERSLLGPSPSE